MTFILDIDECIENFHRCQHDSTCENTVGNYTCVCGLGYTGHLCDEGEIFVIIYLNSKVRTYLLEIQCKIQLKYCHKLVSTPC